MEARELHAVMLEVLKPTTSTDLKFALTWERVSLEVGVRSPDFSIGDVQTTGTRLLVELRMRDEESRTKSLLSGLNPGKATGTRAYANNAEHPEYWSTQEWEGYEAEGAGAAPATPPADKQKLCAAYATKDGCPKGSLCPLAGKGGHPRMKDKCLRCGAEGHMYKSCPRPSRPQQKEADNNNAADWNEDDPVVPAEEQEAAATTEDWVEVDAADAAGAAKGKSKGKGKAKGKGKEKGKPKGGKSKDKGKNPSVSEYDYPEQTDMQMIKWG
eukprot:4978169-Amphidinium_carterae.1